MVPSVRHRTVVYDRLRVGLPRLLATALLLGLAISQVIHYTIAFNPVDIESYLWAGEAWRTTGNPYTEAAVIVNDNPIYRYAPWFALPWVGLSLLPHGLVEIGWSALMVACAFVAVVPMFRAHGARAIPFGGFMLGWLIAIGLNGNVQPAMIALLAWTVERKWGPVAVAVCASLKAVPILYAVVYAGRGEWRKVGVSVALTALLVAPMLAFDIPGISTAAGETYSLFATSPVLWAGVAVSSVGVAFLAARSRFAWVAAGAAVLLALPRAFIYDLTFFVPGVADASPVARGPVDPARNRSDGLRRRGVEAVGLPGVDVLQAEQLRLRGSRRGGQRPALDRDGDLGPVVGEVERPVLLAPDLEDPLGPRSVVR